MSTVKSTRNLSTSKNDGIWRLLVLIYFNHYLHIFDLTSNTNIVRIHFFILKKYQLF